jgi:O-antigen ligase
LALVFSDPSLTGRTPIWNFTVSQFNRSPILGLGFGALWQSGAWINPWLENSGLLWTMNEAHNGYLDIAAQLGIVGALLSCAFFVGATWRIVGYVLRSRQFNMASLEAYAVFVLFGTIIMNATESMLFRPGYILWTQLVLVLGLIPAIVTAARTSDASAGRPTLRPAPGRRQVLRQMRPRRVG